MEAEPRTPIDPDSVFNQEYWMPTQHPFDVPDVNYGVSRKEMAKARSKVAQVAFKAIDGELVGVQGARGSLFNPQDPDLARTSRHNFPGAILLADIERLDVATTSNTGSLEDKDEEEERAKVNSSARELLCSAFQVRGPRREMTTYGGRTAYQNGSMVYGRKTNILYLAQTRWGKVSILEISVATQSFRPEQGVRSYTALSQALGWRAANIGSPHVRYSGSGQFRSAYRLKSIEILASGSPAEAVAPKFFTNLLGNPSPS